MKLSKLKLSVYVGLIFLSGVAVGVFGHRLYIVSSVNAGPPTPAEFRKQLVSEMTAKVKLRPEQVTRLNQILDQTKAKFDAADDRKKKEMRPEYMAIRNEQTELIRQMLDDGQKPAFEQFRQERRERRKKFEQEHKDAPRPPR